MMEDFFPNDSLFPTLFLNLDENRELLESYNVDAKDRVLTFMYQEAPNPVIAFLLGGFFAVLTLITFTMRLRNALRDIGNEYYKDREQIPRAIILRTFLAALIDGDDAMYTIFSQTATALLLLGGFQLHFGVAYAAMLVFYFAVSMIDLIRLLVAYKHYSSLKELVVTTNYHKVDENEKAGKKKKRKKDIYFSNNRAAVTIEPSNIYQNIARNGMMVTIVFISQFCLLTFIMHDTCKSTERVKCFDPDLNDEYKPENCYTTGTMMSWLLYVLGILVQCVYLLGPGNGFGQNHQDPVYWLAVLLASKNGGMFTWQSPNGLGMTGGQEMSCRIRKDDWRLWMRLFITTIINGFGFRVLLHSLPIQLASKKIFVTVIRQALGVTYIAKLDDAAGYTLTLRENPPAKGKGSAEEDEDDDEEDNDDDDGGREDKRGVSTKSKCHDLGVGLLLNNVFLENKKEDDFGREFGDDNSGLDDGDDDNDALRRKTEEAIAMNDSISSKNDSIEETFEDEDDEHYADDEVFC